MILRLLQLLPDSLVEWLALLLLLGLVGAGALGWGWQAGQERERVRADDLARQLEQTTQALRQSRQQASGLAEALAASQDNGADLMRRLMAAEDLIFATEDAPGQAGTGGRSSQRGCPQGLPGQQARPQCPTQTEAAPVAPAAPRAGGDRAFTEALNAW